MNKVFPKKFLYRLGLVALFDRLRWLQCTTRASVVRKRTPCGVGGR